MELVRLQQWVVHRARAVCHRLRGARRAGEGSPPGDHRAVSPGLSVSRHCLPSRSGEKSQLYFAALHPHPAGGGEIVIFDRSWYKLGRGGCIMAFAAEEASDKFLAGTPMVEKALADSGIILLKHWLEVDPHKSRSGGCGIVSTMAARSGSSPHGHQCLRSLG